MDLRALNKICFTICIVCIVIGVVLGLSIIWVTHTSEFAWKGFATVSVVFLGAALTLGVSTRFGGRDRNRPRDHSHTDAVDHGEP